jgi:predicted metal-dependent phosphoesterase TrpH
MTGYDMHIHSTASDGYLDVQEIIDLARSKDELTGIAITDHDTVCGLPRACAYANSLNYPLIAGIELSSEYENHDVHILGYWIDVEKITADGRLEQIALAREERCRRMARSLATLGMPIDIEAVIAAAAETKRSLGRPHVAQAMVEAGYADNIREAFSKWLGRGMSAYAPRLKLSPYEAIEMVAAAGGIAVLAHPGTGVPDHLAPLLARQGLGGIEVYHSDHNKMAERRYLQMAHALRLAAIGGSDFHMPGSRDIGCRITSLEQLRFLAKKKD